MVACYGTQLQLRNCSGTKQYKLVLLVLILCIGCLFWGAAMTRGTFWQRTFSVIIICEGCLLRLRACSDIKHYRLVLFVLILDVGCFLVDPLQLRTLSGRNPLSLVFPVMILCECCLLWGPATTRDFIC